MKLFGEDGAAKGRQTQRSTKPQEVDAEQSNKTPEAHAEAGRRCDRPTMRCRSCTSPRGSRCSCGITSRRSRTSGSTLPELEPGIIARIAKAARERRWEVIFLTTRPSTAGELVQLQSQRWLEAHGFQYPSVFVVQRSRGKIADALQLDAFVDDRPENCLDIAVESKAKVILVWHGDLKDVPAGAKRLGVRPVTTISEAMPLLEQLDDVRSQPSLMRSLKRAFGRDDRRDR